MPSIYQIQNYLRYRRQKQGDSNSLDDVKEYVYGKTFKPYKEDDEMFFFGVKFGDENHIQIRFTSLALLQGILLFGMFHLDATYKIIKYFYPVIIFGITDLNHEFFPIVFIITSHEKAADYVHFLSTLKQLVQKLLKVNFKPSHMVVDASKAMAKAIKQIFPNCMLLMCWFHLKMNVIIRQ